MSVNDTWMPLYIGDYLADTMHLNGAQHGAYLLLLMHYWRNGPLVDDDAQLMAIARCDAKLWRSVGPVVRSFFRASGGMLRQKRMDQERNKWSSISDKRREAGRAGAEAKWKTNGSHPPPDPPESRGADAMHHPADDEQTHGKADGKRMASAIDLPPNLPSEKWQMPEVCQPFATPPLPSKNINSLSFKGVVPASAREEAASAADIEARRRSDRGELLDAGYAGAVVLTLGKALRRPAYAPGWSPKRTTDEQAQAITPHKPKAAYLDAELLRRRRMEAGVRGASSP